MIESQTFGFNVISYVSGNLGIGVTARNVVRVLIERGCPVAILDLDPGQGRKGFDNSFEEYYVKTVEELPYGINLLVLPPAGIGDLLPTMFMYKPNCLNVGFCMWELPKLPKAWISPMQALDVLVAQTQFIRYAFDFNLSDVKTISAVHPMYMPEGIKPDRERYGLPADAVVFFTGFEPHSDPQRKNPFATIRAFLEELGQDERAHLVVKFNNATQNGILHPIVQELTELCGSHPRIHFMTNTLSYHEVLELYASCDVYVSLHRAEGLGLGPMEAMALGRPVISTAWSGNMSYMDHTNSCLVGYDLISVDGSISHYSKEVLGQETVWADAHVAEASAWMRRLIDEPEFRKSIGERAQHSMSAHHKKACQGEFIEELKSIWEHHNYINKSCISVDNSACKQVHALREDKRAEYRRLLNEKFWDNNYQQWIKKHTLRDIDAKIYAERLVSVAGINPVIHLLVTARAGREELLADTLDSIGGQLYENWRLSIITDAQIPEGSLDANDQIQWRAVTAGGEFVSAVNDAALSFEADWVVQVEAGDRLAPQALVTCASYIKIQPQWRLIYVDDDLISKSGDRYDARFKPDMNLDLLRSTPYVGNFLVTRRDAFHAVGGFTGLENSAGYDLTFKCVETFGESAIGHIQDVLYHRLDWNEKQLLTESREAACKQALEQHHARSGLNAQVVAGLLPHSYFSEYEHPRMPLVTLIVPTRDRLDLLQPCVESVLNKTSYPNFEIIVVDNDSQDPETLAYMLNLPVRDKRVRVIRYPHPYNYSAMNNLAARDARGEYLLFLNNDTVVIQPQWLSRMVAFGQRNDVGIVGARLVYPNKTVQHVGLIAGMGVHGVCEHVNIGNPLAAPGYLGRSQMTQNLSVVTAACMLVRKSIYDEVNGFDEVQFKVLFNDVDFCLRVKQRGWKIVWTPYATVLHHGSISLKGFTDTQDETRGRHELDIMLDKWLPELSSDPAFNRNLSLLHRYVSVDTEVDARWDPNFHERKRIMGFGSGSYGAWKYRVEQPLSALDEMGHAQTALCMFSDRRVRVPTIAELERLAPDVLLMHNTLHNIQLDALATYKKHHNAFVVFGEDDLMFALPPSNPFFKTVYKDIKKRMRRGLELADRVVVTTEPLAEALAEMTNDVRIVPNYLRKSIWGDLQSQRRRGDRPRVGWAGAQQHGGDLEMISDVVRETSKEVDWVFFGMCPESIRPYLKEFHHAVSFEEFPVTLASLDLDLAIAPLERNRFNESKSNLRILEYGALGWPVVASDIYPYQDGPVCRVPNNVTAWIKAIRERIHDIDATSSEGDRLRTWVQSHWMLEDHMELWLDVLRQDSTSVCDPVATRIRNIGI